MSLAVSHKPFEVVAYPARAVSPDILYLRMGERIPVSAFPDGDHWTVLVYDSFDDVVSVADEQAAREWLHTYAWEMAR